MENRKKISLIIFVIALLLLLANLYLGFIENNFNYWSIAGNFLLAMAMIFNYRVKAGKENS